MDLKSFGASGGDCQSDRDVAQVAHDVLIDEDSEEVNLQQFCLLYKYLSKVAPLLYPV